MRPMNPPGDPRSYHRWSFWWPMDSLRFCRKCFGMKVERRTGQMGRVGVNSIFSIQFQFQFHYFQFQFHYLQFQFQFQRFQFQFQFQFWRFQIQPQFQEWPVEVFCEIDWFCFKNWEGRPRIQDPEIGSHPSDSVNKKAFQTTQHFSEISLGPKLIVA